MDDAASGKYLPLEKKKWSFPVWSVPSRAGGQSHVLVFGQARPMTKNSPGWVSVDRVLVM
jgi:hypothetical protein